jgi:phage tail sheath gpL-like
VPVISQGVDDARTQYGAGLDPGRHGRRLPQERPFGELWCLPLADAGGAVAAAGSIAFTGPATAAGVLSLYIAGVLVSVR